MEWRRLLDDYLMNCFRVLAQETSGNFYDFLLRRAREKESRE